MTKRAAASIAATRMTQGVLGVARRTFLACVLKNAAHDVNGAAHQGHGGFEGAKRGVGSQRHVFHPRQGMIG